MQITIGIALFLATAIVHAVALGLTTDLVRKQIERVANPKTLVRPIAILLTTMILIMAAHGLEVLLWSLTFVQVGVFDTLEPAFYFSLVAYTTLGFGDVIVPTEWRLLSGFAAANGFLLFGWSTAFQVALLRALAHKVRAARL
jgi:hypothetical protein